MAQVHCPPENMATIKCPSRCPQCHDLFSDPRVLPCLHTLCMRCLQGLEPFSTLERGQNLATQRSVLCPVCDSEVSLPPGGIRDLLPDLLAQTEVLLERLRRGGDEMPCDLCGDGNGEKRCQDCRVTMCEFCCLAHRSVQASTQDNHDGTYHISYTPTEPGQISISVCIKGRHIQGSPFTVSVRGLLRPHCGIYHCCTFCSSGGQKDARCGCGGTMPGGFQGCGHGHKGHPGNSHWSCCGSISETSDCAGVKDSAPRNLLRTVEL